MRILVTDGETRAALAVTRSLGRRGHDVRVLAPAGTRSIAGRSRYCKREHRAVPPDATPAELEGALRRVIGDGAPELVIGVTDRSLTVLLRPGGDGRCGATVAPPPAELYFSASDKVWLFRFARRAGIPVPEGLVVEGGTVPDSGELAELGWPVVIRPALSWRVSEAADQWIHGTVRYAGSAEEVADLVRSCPALRWPFLVQRRVRGDGCGLFLLARDGRIERVFAHRRLREKPPSGGVSTLCVSVEPPADLVKIAEIFARELGWTGLAMLEFKRDEASGRPYLLEVNARPWGSLMLALAAGVDFPSDLVAVATGERLAPAGAYRVGVRLRWWWGDVDHFYLAARERGRSGTVAMLSGLGSAILAGPVAEAWDTFTWDDPLPFFRETAAWLAT